VSKQENESKAPNQSQTPHEFNNRKSGFFSKFGSAAIAIGSLATALSIAVPSFGAFVGETVNSAFGISPATTPAVMTPPAITPGIKLPAAVAIPDLAPIGAGNVCSPTQGGGSSQFLSSHTGASGTTCANGNTSYPDH